MKGRSLIGFMVSLAVLGVGSLTRTQSTTAEPAPIFKPIVRDIQNQLTREMVMRLPALIPFRVKLDALVNSDDKSPIYDLVNTNSQLVAERYYYERRTTNIQALNANTSLVVALRKTIYEDINRYHLNINLHEIKYNFVEVDLNNDETKEAIVSISYGYSCGNRSCPVYIFQKNGRSYHLISSQVFARRGDLKIAVLPSRSKGWLDIATLKFNYDTRIDDWIVYRFNGRAYSETSQKLSSPPTRIVLRYQPGSEIRLADPGKRDSQVATGQSSSPRQQTTTRRSPATGQSTIRLGSQNSQRANRPSTELVTAIRNAVGSNLSDSFDKIEYFMSEVDLNNDGKKEVVVYTAGAHCGAWECPVYIFQKNSNGYRLIGKTGAMSGEAQIAVLPSRTKGWLDIATLVYNPQQRTANWKLHRFNGTTYQNTFQNLSSKPSQIILRPVRGSGISLAAPGIASPKR